MVEGKVARGACAPQAVVDEMAKAGFVPAAVARDICGFHADSSVTRHLRRGNWNGQRVGAHWFVSALSLLRHFRSTPMQGRVEQMLAARGVKAVLGTDVATLPADGRGKHNNHRRGPRPADQADAGAPEDAT